MYASAAKAAESIHLLLFVRFLTVKVLSGYSRYIRRGSNPSKSSVAVQFAVQSFGSRPFWGPYAATKAGLEALGRSWAGESEQTNLKINMMNPGGTATGMRASAFPGENPASLPQPEDIAPAFLTLLAEDCRYHGEVVDARELAGL